MVRMGVELLWRHLERKLGNWLVLDCIGSDSQVSMRGCQRDAATAGVTEPPKACEWGLPNVW